MKIIKQMGPKPFTEGMIKQGSVLEDLSVPMKLEASRELFKNTIEYGYHSERRKVIAVQLQYINDSDWVIENYPELVLKYIL